MLTPAFELLQDKTYLTVIVKAPYAKVSDAEIFIEDEEVRFFSKPYFLRLNLPGKLIEDGRESATYNSDNGSFTIKVPKATEGEIFEGLDMLTKLLTPKGQTSAASPLIQVLDTSNEATQSKETDLEIDEDFDWHVDQEVYVEEKIPLDAPKYGFANTRCGVFKRLQEDIVDVVSLPDPDSCDVTERREKRTQSEQNKFDPEYYLADLYEGDAIQDLMSYRAPWEKQLKSMDQVKFTDSEKEKMRSLPKKEYLLEEKQLIGVYLGLVDLLFAYAYNHRATEGEDNVESAWTICNLSSMLSWLDVFHSLDDVVASSVRRSLCFPLYRQWAFSVKVLSDTGQILQLGKTYILKCLLEIRDVLNNRYPYYILNDLYITDYCVWIQSASDKRLVSLTDALSMISVKKDMVGFNLCEIEAEAAEENDCSVDVITESVSQIALQQHKAVLLTSNTKDSDDDNTDSSDCESTETDDESSATDDESTDNGDENAGSDDRNKLVKKHAENDESFAELDNHIKKCGKDTQIYEMERHETSLNEKYINSSTDIKITNENRAKGEGSLITECV
ncbi:protein SHQ1 homolog [Pecten maximus]|uniref:protein SHQ1 homolog n=1 Tax=Pecten maximus TaxID=6579 RepID=UPI001458A150|nr:protein SHQ1 homolog [Pecten maximus]XP_033746164.1 protein SHQ1 homolog [Pecten maximus]